ncbi:MULTISPECIES: putative quinol monooxygenase [unclassified Imperialibacter]|uniref:putative quinol monooxygenase n=1 Tax=unclassified Imperialibacter TaxID=2629706 RepID=UPI001253F146|nr:MULTISPECIES: putative quinol monooxygenase [unclassified Imperialibacter]CAD5283309.1 Antibiotic biosynthesis monooxygenase [Imperialibacter sp. 89]CAD5286245.1 Antibiotic biosynthesis monooxygenase [Imperialibacter sp. 75]VVT29833.1 Antibiotic biosynthesis monooxygenase [Imperialibacter sp. EC-SDR9]
MATETNSKYGLFGQLKAKPGKGDELMAILMESAGTDIRMPGCLQYLIGKDPDNEDLILISEVWETKEDHANSLKLESVRAAITRAMPLLDGMPEKGIVWEVMGGLGI